MSRVDPADAETPAAPEAAPSRPATIGTGDDASVPPPLERAKPTRKGRAKVPSWDEIVFGAKPDE